MRRLVRGACPPILATRAATELPKAKKHFVDDGKLNGFPFDAYSHTDIKAALGQMSGRNCAYCEADYDVTQPVDVEHFRPKGGVEIGGALSQPGYWWLAAAWENLLPSCIRCNRTEKIEQYGGSTVLSGKLNEFPLIDDTKRAKAPGQEALEEPMLIDPSLEDPSDFIKFVDHNGDCLAEAVDIDEASLSARRAQMTIKIFGLNRAEVVEKRSIYMRRAQGCIARLTDALLELDKLNKEEQAVPEWCRAEAEKRIRSALAELREITTTKDRFTGTTAAFVFPRLAELAVVL